MRWVLAIACCALGAGAPGVALASGGPVPPMQGGSGVSVRGSAVRYVAVGQGRNTVVKSVYRATGKLQRSSRIAGSFGVAAATNDLSATGLSADGRTLVLAGMLGNSYPPAGTRMVVLEAQGLLVHAQIALRGYYAVDAISPTGRWLYLIHYLSPTDLTRYEVRAYDLSRLQMLPRPVVDPRESGAMLGVPITRAMSADGRWAYTLYDRPQSTPFIHALDTQRRVAVCVDLPATIRSTDVWNSRLVLGPGGQTLRIELGQMPLAVVDTRTFAVGPSAAKRAPAPKARHATSPGGGSDVPWALGAVAVVLAALALAARRRSKVTATAHVAG